VRFFPVRKVAAADQSLDTERHLDRIQALRLREKQLDHWQSILRQELLIAMTEHNTERLKRIVHLKNLIRVRLGVIKEQVQQYTH
jgi:hypothetical protein